MSVNLTRRAMLTIGAGFGALALSGFRAGAASLPSTLRVGLSNQLPYAFLDEKGVLTGQSPDVLRAALKGSGIQDFQATVAEFGALLPGLIAKRFDVICTGLFIRPPHCQLIAYGNPDSMSRESMVVKTGNPLKLHSLADVKANPDVKIAILRGGVEENYLKAAGIPESQWVVLPDIVPLLAAVQGGRADVAFCVLTILAPTLEKMSGSGLEFAKDFVDPVVDGKPAIEYAAMGFRKEDDALRTAYNEGLAKLVASGELAAINRKYGLPDALTPTAETPTSDVLCKA